MSGLDDWTRTVLAYLVGFGGLAFIVVAWALVAWGHLTSTEAATIMSAIIGLMGIVLGYYFGSNGKDKADQAAADATSKTDSIKSGAAKVNGSVQRALVILKAAGFEAGTHRLAANSEGIAASKSAVKDLEDASQALSELL